MTYARIPASVCPTCDGEGTVIEFRRFAGEYQAGEPYEVPCPDCEGSTESDYVSPPVSEQDRAAYRAWCAEQDLRQQVERDLRFTMELERKDKAA